MNRLLQGSISVAVLVIAYSTAMLCWQVCRVAQDVDNALTSNINKVGDEIVKPCQGPAGPQACGVLQELNATAIKIGDAVVTTQLQERTAMPHAVAAMDNLNTAALKLGVSADAFTTTANEFTVDETTANATLQSMQPAITAFTESGNDLDTLLRQKALQNFVTNMGPLSDNLVSMTGSGKTILADGAFEADKFAHPPKAKLTGWLVLQGAVKYFHEVEPPLF